MSYRKKIVWGIISSMVGFFASMVLAKPEIFGLCDMGDKKCIYFFIDYFDNVAKFIFAFSVSFFIIFTMLSFIDESVFNYWKKFAKIFLSIAIILIIITPTQHGGFVGIDKELSTWFLAIAFLIISLGIIIWKSVSLKKGN